MWLSWCSRTCHTNADGGRTSSGSLAVPAKFTVSPGCTTRPLAGLVMETVGGRLPITTRTLAEPDTFCWVVAVNCTLNVCTPPPAYVCTGFAAVDEEPSPKSHRYDSGPPLGLLDPTLENWTVS